MASPPRSRTKAPPAPGSRVRTRPLTSVAACLHELSTLYRLARQGRMETQEATRLAYVVRCAGELLTAHRLEERIDAMERAAGAGGSSPKLIEVMPDEGGEDADATPPGPPA